MVATIVNNVINKLNNKTNITVSKINRISLGEKYADRTSPIFVGTVGRFKEYIRLNRSNIGDLPIKEIYFTTTEVIINI